MVITGQDKFAQKYVQYHIIKAYLPVNQWLAACRALSTDKKGF
jgi:hypothetical protein